MKSISFFAVGTPKGQPRPRAFHSGGMTRVYDPGTAEAWKSEIAIAAKPYTAKLSGPIRISLDFFIPRPKSHFKRGTLRSDAPTWCVKKPDADNYAKAVMDAMTYLGFWEDDAQVVSLLVSKSYAKKNSGCYITALELEESK